MKHISPEEAQGQLGEGAYLYLVPYTSNITALRPRSEQLHPGPSPVPETEVRLSYPSLVVAEAAGQLLRDTCYTHTDRVTALGEATFGRCYPTTTQLMAQHLGTCGVRSKAILENSPKHGLDTTAAQLEWVRANLPATPDGEPAAPLIFVGHKQHRARLELLGNAFRLPSNTSFVDAREVLEAAYRYPGPRLDLFVRENAQYEAEALEKTQIMTQYMGARVISLAYKALALRHSPNVVDVVSEDEQPTALPVFIGTKARKRVHHLRADLKARNQHSYALVG